MPILKLSSSSRRLPDAGFAFEDFSHLAVTVSSRLTRMQIEDLAQVVADALRQIAESTRIDDCHFLEFDAGGSVTLVHTWTGAPHAPDDDHQTASPEAWIVERLSRGKQVAISRPDGLPPEAIEARKRARVTGECSILGLPALLGGHVACALVIQSTRLARRWSQPTIDGLQLLTEILGAGVQRCRRENTLRSNVAMIEHLNARLEADNRYLKEEIESIHNFEDIVGESAALKIALTRVAHVAPTNSNVLVLGPTGSGKELFARAVHARSRRHARAFVRVNCAALPPTLVESELFGHEKGAFTGAVGMRQGRFEIADGGTIFLDEIGDLTPDVQVKFLRVLQEGEFERVGSSRTTKVDVRVIAATHHDLEAAVADGRFRADLYYRLNVYPIRLPSLEERAEDIPGLVWFFINRHQRDMGRRITTVPEPVMEALQRRAWPGNIRELENVIERSMIGSTGNVLQLDEPLAFGRCLAGPAQGDSLDSVEREHIEAVLKRCGWRINGKGNAAERLGVHPNTLRFRMKKLGLTRPTPDT